MSTQLLTLTTKIAKLDKNQTPIDGIYVITKFEDKGIPGMMEKSIEASLHFKLSKTDTDKDSLELTSETIDLGRITLRQKAKGTLSFENAQKEKLSLDCIFDRLLIEPSPGVFKRFNNIYKVFIELGLKLNNGNPICMVLPLGEPIWSNDPRCKALVEFHFTPIKQNEFVCHQMYELTGDNLNAFLKEIQFSPGADSILPVDDSKHRRERLETVLTPTETASSTPAQGGLNFAQTLHDERYTAARAGGRVERGSAVADPATEKPKKAQSSANN